MFRPSMTFADDCTGYRRASNLSLITSNTELITSFSTFYGRQQSPENGKHGTFCQINQQESVFVDWFFIRVSGCENAIDADVLIVLKSFSFPSTQLWMLRKSELCKAVNFYLKTA